MTAIQNTPVRPGLNRAAKAVREKKKKRAQAINVLVRLEDITYGYWKELKTLTPYCGNQPCKYVHNTQNPGRD